MSLQSQMAADLAHAVGELPTLVTWGVQTFNAVVGDIGHQDGLTIDGVTESATVTVDYVLSVVNGTIKENDVVTIGGVNYRVMRPYILPDGLTGRFECVGGME
jgi:hypothetical protein